MKVRDLMVKNVSTCKPDQNLAEVAAIMWKERCGSLPVVDEAGNVTSIITDRDICIALGTRNSTAAQVRVKDVSLPRVFTCGFGDEIRLALNTMVSQNVRRLPVIDSNGKIAGILSIDDLLLHSQKRATKSGISEERVVDAAKSILKARRRDRVHEAAELVATHA